MREGSKRRWVVLWGLGGGREALRLLRGSARAAVDEGMDRSAATRAARVLGPDHERRWGWLMRRRSRRALVIVSAVTWVLPIAGGSFEALGVPFAGVAIGFLLSTIAYGLLQQASRLVTDLPDGYLDERQLDMRNESFAVAYKVLAGTVATVALVAFAWVEITSNDGGAVSIDIATHWSLAAFLSVTMMMQTLPAAVLAWCEPEPTSEPEAPRAGMGISGGGYPERPDGHGRR